MTSSVARLDIKVTRTTISMGISRAKGGQQSFRNLLLCAAGYDAVCQQTILPIQNIMKVESNNWKQKNVRLGET